MRRRLGMCGIVGYIGDREATDILVGGLHRLEYRGYDSAGVAVQNGKGILTRKVAGRVAVLEALVGRRPVHGRTGIAHTRWATHGAPNRRNAHPHRGCSREIALVHNGIIENAEALRVVLRGTGHTFRTETDTETLVHLIEAAGGLTLEERVIAALRQVTGTYGIAVMSDREPGKIVAARRGSPVLLGIGEGEFLVASDPSAVMDHTREVVYLEDGDVAVVTRGGFRILDLDGTERVRAVDAITWSPGAIDLAGYPHYMLKEIHEQPRTVISTLNGRVTDPDGPARLADLRLSPADIRRLRGVTILACGTSWHAGLVGRCLIEELANLPVRVEYASEHRYQKQLDLRDTLVVAVSQSGETADTLEAMRAAKAAGGRVIGVVNTEGSSIAREASGCIYLHAGPEIGVASTKAFTSQIVAMLLLALHLGRHRDLPCETSAALLAEMARLPALIEEALALDPQVREIARIYANARNFLYLGRGANFPVALEGALKLKEISYIHAEGLPAAEMKHGPIALIDENMPVVFVAPRDHVYEKVVSNIQEVRARNGRTIVVTTKGNGDLGALADHQLRVPDTIPELTPLLTVIPLQLLAYHVAVLRGCDVDRPRNLAKSVTVE
ncbi:MAG TPA: glutamine--fructose-6-phosphate transaminase (isomerizing) [Gemmatimonadota bacterium]|nr:glutamine--fructose-6-phosphate transaminase (isomerizing) [Gemmatimonadota bacterium]